MDVTAASRPEPAPRGGNGDVWAEILAELPEGDPARAVVAERRAFGIAKYGQPLRRDDGRRHLVDLLQELLDAWAYARAAGDPEEEASAAAAVRRVLGKM